MAGTRTSLMHSRIRNSFSRPRRRKLGHRCIPDLACMQPAQEIYTVSRKIDGLLSKITLLCFTRSCCFVVYLSVTTASVCAGSAKHVSAAMPASQSQAPRLQDAKKSVKEKRGISPGLRFAAAGDGKFRTMHCGA